MKFELSLSREILEKHSNIKLREIHPVGANLFHAYRQTDGKNRHDEGNCRFSQFCERA